MKRGPKIVAVASAGDLDFRYGCTPTWWQLWKRLHDVDVDPIIATYRRKAIESRGGASRRTRSIVRPRRLRATQSRD
jgi:hypothetical protein